jgi:uncharacterized membrane protein
MAAGWMRPIAAGWMSLVAGVWIFAGAAVELFNAWTRRLVVGKLAPERRMLSMGWFAGGFVVRVVLTAGVLALAFRHSFASGLMALLGYYVCRMVVTWRLARRLERQSGEGGSGHRLGSKDG